MLGLAISLGLAAVLMAWQGNFLREKIIRPLSFAFWIITILIRGTPQAIFWGILVFITVIMALRSLFAPAPAVLPAQPYPTSTYRRSRLRYWLHQLFLERYESARLQLYEAIARLSLDVLAYQQGVTLQQYQRQVDSRTIQPSFLAPFLEARSQPLARQTNWNLDELKRVVKGLQKRLIRGQNPPPIQNPEIERVIAYLEEQMNLE